MYKMGSLFVVFFVCFFKKREIDRFKIKGESERGRGDCCVDNNGGLEIKTP